MQLLVQFENVRAAYALSDYLNVQGIPSKVVQETSKAAVYLQRVDDLSRAQIELEAFVRNPTDKKYLSASWEEEAAGGQRPAIDQVYQQGESKAGKRWQRTGLFTKAVIAVCAIVFVVTAFGSNSFVRYFFFFNYWGQMFEISQAWRWITPVFLHFGFLHFTFNLLWWWDIASLIERLQGSFRLMYIFMLLSIVPNLAQFYSAGNRFGGLSGVVFGVLGYVWVYGQVRKNYPLQLRPVVMYMMVGWMLIGFSGALDKVVGSMANEAHLAGLVTGILLGLGFAFKDRNRKHQA